MVTNRIKTPAGKKLGPSSFASFPHYPLFLAFGRRPFLGAKLPGIGRTPQPSHRKICEAQNTFYTPGMNPSPLEAGGRVPSRCTTPTPFVVNL